MSSNNTDEKSIIQLTDGTFRDEAGLCYVFPSVRTAKEKLHALPYRHEYLPSLGLPSFNDAVACLCLGRDTREKLQSQTFACQTISNTGGLHLGAMLLMALSPGSTLYIGSPSWGNHFNVFKHAGISIKTYQYFDITSHSLCWDQIIGTIQAAPNRSIFLWQPCGHNPVGIKLTKEQWKDIGYHSKRKSFLTIFDMAYQGTESGNPDIDVWPIQHFAHEKLEFLLNTTFSKSMGLYSERVGALLGVFNSISTCQEIARKAERLIRWEYSSPPAYGAQLAAMILTDEALRDIWYQDVAWMARKLRKNRSSLKRRIIQHLDTKFPDRCTCDRKWDTLEAERGFFSLLPLSSRQVDYMKAYHGVVIQENGRINIAGLRESILDIVAAAIADASMKDTG